LDIKKRNLERRKYTAQLVDSLKNVENERKKGGWMGVPWGKQHFALKGRKEGKREDVDGLAQLNELMDQKKGKEGMNNK
jgi:hypothetical protein